MYTFLSGYGVYLTAAVAAAGKFLQSLGIITPENWETLLGILIPVFAIFFRRAIATSKAAVIAEVEEVKAKVATVETRVAAVAPTVARVVSADVKAEVQAEVAAAVQDAERSHRPGEAPHLRRQ